MPRNWQDLLDEYEPTLQETLKTVSSLSVSANKTIRDTQKLVTDTEALLKAAGTPLDAGTKQSLEALASVLRGAARTMSTAGEIKDAKTSICEIIEDTWDEYTGDVNNLLLMDATAEAVSLTDSRNPAPRAFRSSSAHRRSQSRRRMRRKRQLHRQRRPHSGAVSPRCSRTSGPLSPACSAERTEP